MQGHCSGRLDDVPAITVSRLESCIVDIYAWSGAKGLQLNADKTELLWFGSASQLRRLASHSNRINVNQCVVKSMTVVRDPGVWFDADSYQCARTFLGWHRHVFLSFVPNTCRSTTARPRRHSKDYSYSTGLRHTIQSLLLYFLSD